jgi:DNA polymerase III delta subunit
MMVITLTGNNSYGLQTELTRLTNEFVANNSQLGLLRLDGEEVEINQIDEALTNVSLFSPNKLVILRSPSKNKQFSDQVEQILENISEGSDVILVEPQLDKRLSYYKTLKKNTDLRDYPELDAQKLIQWAVAYATASGGQLSQADARYLVERVGVIQQLIERELDKLITYQAEISRSTIDALTEPTPQTTVFQLMEAAFAGRSARALGLYKEQRDQKVEPPQILAMLSWQLQVLAIIKTARQLSIDQVARDAKLSPYVLRKSQAIAKKLSMADLKQLIADLLDIDMKSKQTNLDIDGALQAYLLKLTNL